MAMRQKAMDTRAAFAPPDDVPIAYMERTRRYYEALGYPPYEWAHYSVVPCHPLRKPLPECRVAIVTTAAPYQPGKGPQGPLAPYNAAAKFHAVYSGDTDSDPDLRISHVAIDRDHTTAEDQNSYFPLPALRSFARRGKVRLAPRFHGLPTRRSQRVTLIEDIPDLLERLHEDRADAVIFVPNCPVCHQSVSLAAWSIERAGLPTVVMGCAKDIVEHVGVPRFVFADFPLGNAAGKPNDPRSQLNLMGTALRMLKNVTDARTTVQARDIWSCDPSWKKDYCSLDRLTPEVIARRRAEHERDRELARQAREAAAGPC
jgi:hypothetical protein